MKKTSTKGALFTSTLALLLCFVMLLGTTFAWFTDEVTSTNNKIQAGTLEIDLLYKDVDEADYISVKELIANGEDTAIFDYTNWEPGYIEAKHVKVETDGTLALKYTLKIVPLGDVDILADVIEVYYAAEEVPVDRSLAGLTKIGTLRDVIDGAQGTILNDQLIPDEAAAILGETADVSDSATIALKMIESAGNEYQGKKIGTTFDINLYATQFTYEPDSFDNMYDNDSTYAEISVSKVEADTTEATLLVVNEVSAQLPAGIEAGIYKLSVTNKSVVEDQGETAVSYNIDLYKNDEKVSGVTIPVEIYVGTMLNITSVKHDGNEIANFTYDVFDGVVKFETDSFSPFEIVYNEIGKDVEVDSEARKITKGYFAGVDPTTYDPSLNEADSEYLVVKHTKDGKDCYAVNSKAKTVIAVPAEADVAALKAEQGYGDDVYVVAASGKLWKLFTDDAANRFTFLANADYDTVYIMPGTYNEGTTINVYFSVDIIGLGEKDSVKVVKQSSSSSNRHLFNCSGTKADYINVTLRNLYLDATAKTTNSKDNDAVQSIRKTKVKCYDLTVVKGTALDAVAFYVNGNNAVDGVKYPAYLYAENCDLNTTRTFGIVTTAGTYKFYHNNLTYNNGTAYTSNSGSIKNVAMDPEDWEW